MTKSNCKEKTKKLNVAELKLSHKLRTQIMTKLKNSNCDKNLKKLKLGQNLQRQKKIQTGLLVRAF